MKERVWLCIACILIDVAAIAGFVYLAVFFNHWWIALFAYIFIYTPHFDYKKKDSES